MPEKSRTELDKGSHRASVILKGIDDNQQRRPFQSLRVHNNKGSLASDQSSSQQIPLFLGQRRRSVKSITEEYELHHLPSDDRFGSIHAKRLSFSPSLASIQARSEAVGQGEAVEEDPDILDRQESNYKERLLKSKKAQRASILLASPRYPFTLKTGDSSDIKRARRVSTSIFEVGPQNATQSLRLSSAIYPSSYKAVTSPGAHFAAATVKKNDMSSHDSRTSTIVSLPTVSISHEEDAGNAKVISRSQGTGVVMVEEEGGDVMTDLSSCPPSPKREMLLAMTPAERREHSRRHSRVHSRNLSVFFPQPGSEAERESDHLKASSQYSKPDMTLQTYLINGSDQNEDANSTGFSSSPTKSRRGHHRNHSVNHGFLNVAHSPSIREEAISPKTTRFSLPDATPALHNDRKMSKFSNIDGTPEYVQALSKPISHHLRFSSLPRSHRPLLLFGCFEFILGAMLWWHGQSGDSLSLTGLGYLVVFDAFGILNGVAAECLSEGWRRQEDSQSAKETFRKPYG